MKMKKLLVLTSLVVVLFSGCGIGSILELPFKVVGGVVDIVDPTAAVSGAIEGAGSAINMAIPF
jgi:hypothetical protein